MRLYRPVGVKELSLIIQSGWRSFPPRLLWQPIFYPVLQEEYAVQIAAEWNANDAFSGYCGIVTVFEVDDDFIKCYPIQNVGASMHDELWIPAADLPAFNEHLLGTIRIKTAFFGKDYQPSEDEATAKVLLKFRNKDL